MIAQTATVIRTEDWEWADSILDARAPFDLFLDIDETEFIPETGNHVYQLSTGSCIAITPDGDVLFVDRDDLDE